LPFELVQSHEAARTTEPQHLLYFFPLPHVQGSFRPIFRPADGLDGHPGIVSECPPCCTVMPPTNIDAACAGDFT
jgi:hypothetical protein